MRLEEALTFVADSLVPSDLERFREHIDPVWIEEALASTGTATVRKRRMPAEQVLWLVIGMALMRNDSIERVAATLDLALPVGTGHGIAKSSLAEARQRLGDEPLAYLFGVTGDFWAERSAKQHAWRGLYLFGADGSTMRVPDSKENWKEFGGQKGGARAGSAYPTVRLLGLMALRSHLLSSLVIADYATGETTMWRGLWKQVPDNSLLVVDRAFLVAAHLTAIEQEGRGLHWMTRAKSTTRLRRIRRLGTNDDLVEIQLSDQTRRNNPGLPAMWTARAIRYQRKGFRPSTVLTSLLDSKAYPADEVVGIYHERWELELGYDEIKTHLLAREETIRSKTPKGVRQEIWGIGLAYNLVRLEMEKAAEEAGVEPTRISFVNAVALIRYAWIASSAPPIAPGTIPKRLLDVRRHLKLLLLPERRPERSYPRAVKIKMSNYARKRPSGKGR